MADGFIHTVHKAVSGPTRSRAAPRSGYANKEAAVTAGRGRARQDRTEHLINEEDGTIGERNSYGNDPAARPG
jgi:hypothetical protein